MSEKIYLQDPEDGVGVRRVLRGPASGPFKSSDFETAIGVPPRPPDYSGLWNEWRAERGRVLTALGLASSRSLDLAYVEWLKTEHGFEEMEWEWL